MKIILLINVKLPTIVGILTFTSMINTISERLKTRNFFICQYFSFYEQLKFRAQLQEHEKRFIISGQGDGSTDFTDTQRFIYCIDSRLLNSAFLCILLNI